MQGILGGYFAEAQGFEKEVCVAVSEHYLPTGYESKIPKKPYSIALSLSDKLDTLVGFFGLNLKPTSSKDPFALRRFAIGLLKIVLENNKEMKLRDLINYSCQLYNEQNIIFDFMFTSDLIRAQLTGEIILKEMDQAKTETIKDNSLNERAYGDLTGMDKDEARAKFGKDQVHIWRRSYDISPPGGESLKDTHDRVIPFFKENIEPEISSKNILIAAHGNSLRALVKHLENISEQEIVQLEIATGVPIIYKFSDGSYTKQ